MSLDLLLKLSNFDVTLNHLLSDLVSLPIQLGNLSLPLSLHVLYNGLYVPLKLYRALVH